MNEELWCLHLQGPDDLHAAPSREAAEHVANKINRCFAAYDIKPSAVAVRWELSAEAHSDDLKNWSDWA